MPRFNFAANFSVEGKVWWPMVDDISLVFPKGLDSTSARNLNILRAIRFFAEITLRAHMHTMLVSKRHSPMPVVAMIFGGGHGGNEREKSDFKNRW